MTHEQIAILIRWLEAFQSKKYRNLAELPIEELASLTGIPVDELDCPCDECRDRTIKPC